MPHESSAEPSPQLAAWKQFCRSLENLGERILEDDFPNQPRDQVEGIAHLAAQVSTFLGWAIPHGDPTAPFFQRTNDLFTQWGGPNQDNAYRCARVDPKRRYRIRGRMHSCEHFAITLRVGFMFMKEWGTKGVISSVDHGITSGSDFEILLGGDGTDPNFTPIPEGVTTLHVREYYLEWQPAEPAHFTIECLDDLPTPAPKAGEALAQEIDFARELVECSMLNWNDYLRQHRANGTDNTFSMKTTYAKGLSDARYAFLIWDLAPDEMLLIETDVPRARYWNLQLANLGWFEAVDWIHRITSINHRQAFVGSDGRSRFVIAHEDPGVPNWLDTAQHRNGLCTYRWFWPESDPTPTTRVVKRDELHRLLPSDTPVVDEAARREEVRVRKRHLGWRFRT
ncbi:MAG: hypothetical protein JRF61_27985 [Deltaproteobacteria bacterium]|jgi:hypothetical protein|nr:hypothetical protein [Deltaproteobacteria bacterium]